MNRNRLLLGIVALIAAAGIAMTIGCQGAGDETGCAHEWGNWNVTLEPVCEADGTSARVCQLCGQAQTMPLPALGHHMGEWGIAAGLAARDCLMTGCGYGERRALVQMSAGSGHSAAVDSEGSLWVWGQGVAGRLGLGDVDRRNFAVQHQNPSGVTGWASVSAGGMHTMAIDSAGGLWAWGANGNGRLGLGAGFGVVTAPERVPNPSGVTGWASVSAGGIHTMAIDSDGGLWGWGSGEDGRLGLGLGAPEDDIFVNHDPGRVQNPSDVSGWATVVAGGTFTAAICVDGSLWTWGMGVLGQLGLGGGNYPPATHNRYLPEQVPNPAGVTGWTAVSLSDHHGMAISTDGRLWVWGQGNEGRLGQGPGTSHHTNPDLLQVLNPDGVVGWAGVGAGFWFSMAIDSGGGLWAWGSNWGTGRLGLDSSTLYYESPQRVQNPAGAVGWASVAASDTAHHTLAIDTEGRIWAWGFNGNGQLGIGGGLGSYGRPILVGPRS